MRQCRFVAFLRYDLLIGYRDHSPGVSSPGLVEILNEKLNHIRLRDWNPHLLFETKKACRDSVLGGRRVTPLLSTDQVGDRWVIRIHQDGKGGVPRNVLGENLPRSVLSTANSAESDRQSWQGVRCGPVGGDSYPKRDPRRTRTRRLPLTKPTAMPLLGTDAGSATSPSLSGSIEWRNSSETTARCAGSPRLEPLNRKFERRAIG